MECALIGTIYDYLLNLMECPYDVTNNSIFLLNVSAII